MMCHIYQGWPQEPMVMYMMLLCSEMPHMKKITFSMWRQLKEIWKLKKTENCTILLWRQYLRNNLLKKAQYQELNRASQKIRKISKGMKSLNLQRCSKCRIIIRPDYYTIKHIDSHSCHFRFTNAVSEPCPALLWNTVLTAALAACSE